MGGGAAWTVAARTGAQLSSVSCAAASSCVAGDRNGDLLASVPTPGEPAWGPQAVDPGHAITGVSCAAPSFCAAVDDAGRVFTTNDPAAGPGAWETTQVNGPGAGDQHVACPSTGFCVIVEASGKAFVSSDPTGGAPAWQSASIDPGHDLSGVSCVSALLCVAIDSEGNALTSEDPARGAWSSADVDGGQALTGVSCTTSLCVVIDGQGSALSSADPAGGATAWTGRMNLGDAGVLTEQGLVYVGDPSAVSCASSASCVVVDSDGNVITTSDPLAASGSWRPARLGTTGQIVDLACPTDTFCAAVDDVGNVLVSTDPTAGAQAWTVTTVRPAASSNGTPPLPGISCPTPSLCVAVASDGDVLTSTDPSARAPAWVATKIADTALWAISCPSTTLCVATDAGGEVLTSTDPTGGAGAWHAASAFGTDGLVEQLACPSVMLCVGADSNGDVVSTTDPTGGAAAWRAVSLMSAHTWGFVSCPSGSLCVAGNAAGQLYTSTDPTGDAASWQPASAEHLADVGGGVACATAQLCFELASDGFFRQSVLTASTDPSGGPLAWRSQPSPFTSDASDFDTSSRRLTCPSASLCIAYGDDAEILTTTDPTVDPAPSAWQATQVDGGNRIGSISCPTSGLCAAIDDSGRILTSTEPAAGTAWRSTYVPGLTTPLVESQTVPQIACASAGFCLATDVYFPQCNPCEPQATQVTSTDPRDGSWVSSGNYLVGLKSIVCPAAGLCLGLIPWAQGALVLATTNPDAGVWAGTDLTASAVVTALACASDSFCAVGDTSGEVWTSSDPAAASPTWTPASVDAGHSIASLSCPSTSLCLGVDDAGNVLVSANPAGGVGTWSVSPLPFTNRLSTVDCPAVTFCVGIDNDGDAASTADPAGGGSQWSSLELVDPRSSLTSLSCPTALLCVAGDELGNVFTGVQSLPVAPIVRIGVAAPPPIVAAGRPPALARQAVLSALAGALATSCRRERIGTLLRAGHCPTRFSAPGAGTLSIVWRSSRGVELASAQARPARARKLTVTVRLSKAGRRALRAAVKTVWIRVTASFVPKHGPRAQRSERFELRR